MYIQVANHLIAAPATDQLDEVAFNADTEEHHGTCGAEVTSGDLLGFKSQV